MVKGRQNSRAAAAAGAAGLAATVLVGCGENVALRSGSPPVSAPTRAAEPVTYQPVKLVGWWRLQAAGEERGAVLHLGAGLSLWGACGKMMGGWGANTAGMFLADVHGWSDAWARKPGRQPAWLVKAVGFRPQEVGFALVDAGGREVARLLPRERPKPGSPMDPVLDDPPIADWGRHGATLLRAPKPLPTPLRPADREELVGRWIPADRAGRRDHPQSPHVRLTADGSWHGSDGCNGLGGRWTAGDGGAVLATAGAQTAIGCENLDVGSWLTGANRAGFAGDVLVLLDVDGKETGRLVKVADPR
jgi:hypothetical protein